MGEFKRGQLHSGSKTGPVVKNRRQAIAIAMSQTGQSKHAFGGGLHLRRAPRSDRGMPHMKRGLGSKSAFSGFVKSSVPGRTDKHQVDVAKGSYVLPADHVSAMGQNNSLAGAANIQKMFGAGGRWGSVRLKPPKFASGGSIGGSLSPIIVAGGEHVLTPDEVARAGGGNLEKGFNELDKWVLETREKHGKKILGLKPPKKFLGGAVW